MQLRDYQFALKADVNTAWQYGARNVLMRLDTGGGKTAIIANMHEEHQGASAVIAHRQELVSQLSFALARYSVRHSLIASQSVRRAISAAHIQEYGRSFYDPSSRHAVVSIDTLPKAKGIEAWLQQVTLWTCDEAHHVLKTNKWGTGLARFTHRDCRGLLPTATPGRADGKGLGSYADGIADAMVEGPPMRWLIEEGYLTDYRIICPESDLTMLEEVGATGDWSTKQLKEASERSHIVGDIVAAYLAWTPGKLGITFTTDVSTAEKVTAAFRQAGVRAETLTGETEDGYRRHILRQLATRQIDQIVVVDIVSEGFDLPAVEVGSMGRPSGSLALYMQQFGRLLRPMYAPGFDLSTRFGRLAAIAASSKPYAVLIDHAGNTVRHQGPPDKPRVWTLDRREKSRGGGGGIPMRVCLCCKNPYESVKSKCPRCGTPAPAPESRGSPAMVAGDMAELDPVVLAALRGEVAAARLTPNEFRAQLQERRVRSEYQLTQVVQHEARQQALNALSAAMTDYVRLRLSQGYVDREIHRAFYANFGIDVISAQALSRADATALEQKVRTWLASPYSITA